jgi:hypothetical protein
VTWHPIRTQAPTRKKAAKRAPTRKVTFEFSLDVFYEFRSHVRGLAGAYGTRDDAETIRLAVARQWELVERDREAAARQSEMRDREAVARASTATVVRDREAAA